LCGGTKGSGWRMLRPYNDVNDAGVRNAHNGADVHGVRIALPRCGVALPRWRWAEAFATMILWLSHTTRDANASALQRCHRCRRRTIDPGAPHRPHCDAGHCPPLRPWPPGVIARLCGLGSPRTGEPRVRPAMRAMPCIEAATRRQ
jgi:hypothetical protein